MIKKLNSLILRVTGRKPFRADNYRAQSGQSIIVAVIAVTFMAGIGYALIMWSRAQSRQAVQKEQHGSAEEIGKAGVDQAVYEIMHGGIAAACGGEYKWGDAVGEGLDGNGSDEDWLTVTLPDGTTATVHLEEIGELIEP